MGGNRVLGVKKPTGEIFADKVIENCGLLAAVHFGLCLIGSMVFVTDLEVPVSCLVVASGSVALLPVSLRGIKSVEGTVGGWFLACGCLLYFVLASLTIWEMRASL